MNALWALRHGQADWLHTVELAIVHESDSDSTGAVVGGLLGCMGASPPLDLVSRLDVLGTIERLVDRYPKDGKV
jgi:ADP-ribosylglycohydrolase